VYRACQSAYAFSTRSKNKIQDLIQELARESFLEAQALVMWDEMLDQELHRHPVHCHPMEEAWDELIEEEVWQFILGEELHYQVTRLCVEVGTQHNRRLIVPRKPSDHPKSVMVDGLVDKLLDRMLLNVCLRETSLGMEEPVMSISATLVHATQAHLTDRLLAHALLREAALPASGVSMPVPKHGGPTAGSPRRRGARAPHFPAHPA
jgi:hypothetical protein